MKARLICAVAMALGASAYAGKSKSLDDCTTFTQTDKDDDTVEMSIQNSCKVPIDCSVSWRVVCAPDSAKRRSVHAASKKLSLTEGGAGSAEASATVCGDDAWSIEAIKWGCEPNKD